MLLPKLTAFDKASFISMFLYIILRTLTPFRTELTQTPDIKAIPSSSTVDFFLFPNTSIYTRNKNHVKDLLYCLVRFITSKRGARGQNGGEWLHMRNGNEQVSQGRQQEGVGCVEAAGTRSVRTLY